MSCHVDVVADLQRRSEHDPRRSRDPHSADATAGNRTRSCFAATRKQFLQRPRRRRKHIHQELFRRHQIIDCLFKTTRKRQTLRGFIHITHHNIYC